MPIYAYRCEQCGAEKDVLQKIADAPLVDCPSCGKPAFRRVVTAAAFQLKGSGWYVTDFRDGNKGKKPADAKPDAQATPADGGATPAPASSGTADGGQSSSAAPASGGTSTPAASPASPAPGPSTPRTAP